MRDESDFEALFRRYAHRIRAIAMRRLRDRQLAEDVVQETLLKAYRYRAALDPDRPAWPWLSAIAMNVCSDMVARERREPNSLLMDFSDPDVEIPAVEADVAEVYSDREVLMQVLESLPPLHRRILLLSAEGWSYKDIADLEGLSFFALQSALQRARRRFRSLYEKLARGGSKLPSIVLLPAWLGGLFRKTRARTRVAMDQVGHFLANIHTLSTASSWAGSLEPLLALTLIAIIGAGTVGGSEVSDYVEREGPQVAAPANISAPSAKQTSIVAPGGTLSTLPYGEEAEDALGLGPVESEIEETPEDSTMGPVAVSPNYEADHTLYASGCSFFRCNLLFVSRDGGASWDKLPAVGYVGSNFGLMLPPMYPKDNRIFSAHYMGLQESRDGGKTFTPLVSIPLYGTGAAISPRFGRGDAMIYLSTVTGLMEYDRELNTVRSSALPLPIDGFYNSFAVSPTPDDPIVLVAISRHQKSGDYVYNEHYPYRCQRGFCEKVKSYNGFASVRFTYSSRFAEDGTIYLHAPSNIFASSDRGKSFASYPVPKSEDGLQTCCNDLVSLPGTSSGATWIGAGWADFGGVYRSDDQGDSWSPIDLNLPRDQIPMHLSTTPTGRVIATGWRYGVACSVDGGLTWSPRCSTES